MTRSPHRTERPLDTAEASFHALNATGAFLVTQIATVEGPLHAGLLHAALSHVQERHPLLRARIAPGAAPRWFTPPSGSPPLTVAPPGTDPVALAEDDLHRLFRVEDEPLWRCALVPDVDPRRHHLVLGTHHAVADGRSAWQVLADVLATCAALVRGGPLPPLLPPGPSLDDVVRGAPVRARLAHAVRRARERLGLEREVDAPVAVEAEGPRRSRILWRTLPAAQVVQLLARARATGTTLSGALAAALLPEAAAADLALLPMNHAVSLRRWTARAIPAEQLGCFATCALTRHRVTPARPLWGLAREVSGGLHALLRRGDPLAGVTASRGPFARLEATARRAASRGGLGPVALSSCGRFLLGDTAPFVLRGWHGATGNHVQGHRSHFSCATVGGELSIGFVHVDPLLSRAGALASMERIEERLRRMAWEAAPCVAPSPGGRRDGALLLAS